MPTTDCKGDAEGRFGLSMLRNKISKEAKRARRMIAIVSCVRQARSKIKFRSLGDDSSGKLNLEISVQVHCSIDSDYD